MLIFCSRKAREGCQDLANERAPKNELTNHVSDPLNFIEIVVLDKIYLHTVYLPKF